MFRGDWFIISVLAGQTERIETESWSPRSSHIAAFVKLKAVHCVDHLLPTLSLSLALSLLGKMVKPGFLVNGFCMKNIVSESVSFCADMLEKGSL